MASLLNKRTVGQNILLWSLCVFFIIYSFTLIYPIFWTVVNSLKEPREFIRNLYGLPKKWVWENYVEAFKINVLGTGIVKMTINNIIVSGGGLILCMFSCSLSSYTLSKYPFKGSRLIYNFMLVVTMLPFSASIPATYNFFKVTGLYNTHFSVIFLIGGGFGYPFLLLFNFYESLSWTYAESAQMDGASNFKVFWYIMFPQSLSMVFAITIMIFMGIWGDFTDVYLYMPSYPTLAVGIKLLSDNMQSSGQWPALFAAMLVTTVPIGVLYIFANRQFYNMRIETGIKG